MLSLSRLCSALKISEDPSLLATLGRTWPTDVTPLGACEPFEKNRPMVGVTGGERRLYWWREGEAS